MELYKGVYQIASLFGGRRLFQYFFSGKRTVLLDSGIADTPENVILPYIDRLGLDPRKLSMLITTHPDADHQGGNGAIRRAAPNALLACGEADRPLIDDPEQLYAQRYNHLRASDGLGLEPKPADEAGTRCRVDLGFRGGERIVLDYDWQLEVLHVPGHSIGHLALYDHTRKTAFVSDAVHGHGCPGVDGSIALPVTYFRIDLYISTLRQLKTLDLQALHTGHWPSMYGDEIQDFLSDSRRTVEIIDRRILRSLTACPSGLTLRQLIEEVSSDFPEWPAEVRHFAMFPVQGHLEYLESKGQVQLIRTAVPRRWQSV